MGNRWGIKVLCKHPTVDREREVSSHYDSWYVVVIHEHDCARRIVRFDEWIDICIYLYIRKVNKR